MLSAPAAAATRPTTGYPVILPSSAWPSNSPANRLAAQVRVPARRPPRAHRHGRLHRPGGAVAPVRSRPSNGKLRRRRSRRRNRLSPHCLFPCLLAGLMPPGATWPGVLVLVSERSADVLTSVVCVAELFSELVSLVVVVIDAVLVIVEPLVADGLTFTVSTKVWAAPPAASELRVLVIVPVPPAVGVVFDQPVGLTNDTNVVFAGIASLSETLCAAPGPAFATTIV